MADMDLSTQLDALDEVNQNVTDRPKGFTGESGLLGDIYADGIANKFKTHLRNKRDVDNMDSMIASEAESHRFDAAEWEKEVKYRQDLLDDPSISGQDVDLLKKNLEYAQKRHKEASELYAKTNSLRARNLDDLPGTALERGLFRGLGEIARTGAATAQNITESLGYEETARGIGTVRDIIGPDGESKAFQMRPLEWAEAKGVGGIASYVGEKAGGVLPWLAAGIYAPYTTFGYGAISGQGDMRRLLEEQGVTDKATLRKTSYIYGTLMGGLMNVVPWVTMKGLTPNAMRAFQGTVTKIATRMATHTATTTSAQVAASALASWAETFGINYATGKPVNWEEALKKSIETGGENIVPGLLFGMFGEGHKALAGGYKVAKGGTPEQPQTAPTEPAKTQPTPEEIKAAEERKLAKLATEKTPEAATERQTIRAKQQDAEKQALTDQHDAISKELEALDKEMAAIESNPELSDVERAALTAEANLKRSPLIEQSDALVAEMEKFTVQEPEVYQAPPEPDVPEGHTRFYHGGFPGAAKGDVWFTTSRQDADGWASRGPNMRVQYVDVKNGDPRVDWGDLANGFPMRERQTLPPELATQRKVIEAPTAEPQTPKVTDQERADFTAILRTDAARDTWAEKLGVTPEKLAGLVEDARQRGVVRIDRHGVARRTGKLYFSEPEKPIQMPDGEVTVKTELAQEKWGEMQSAVDEAVNELTDGKVKAVVREKIEALRSTFDQKYAMAKKQTGGSLSERVFGPQSSVSEAGGGNRGTAAREPGNKAAPATPKIGDGAEGAGAVDARILRSEAATIRENGTPIVGRRIRGKAGYREGNNIQRVGTTRKLGLLPDHETLVTAEKIHSGDDKDIVAKLTYRVFDKGAAPDKSSPRDSAHKALIELKQHDDGAWEIAYVEVAPRARGEGLATKLYAKVAKDIGIKQMSPSGQLTNDGYAYWSKRSPESVKWHQPSPTEEGMYYSPRHIKDEIARLEGYVKDVDKRTYLSDADKAEFVSSYRQEIADLQRMWESLPDEAKTRQATDSMFALRGFYSPAIRAVEKIKQAKGTGAQFLAQIIKSPGVRREELDWMSVDEFLRENKSVTKQEVIDFMRAHQMNLVEVVLGKKDRPDIPVEESNIGKLREFIGVDEAELPNGRYDRVSTTKFNRDIYYIAEHGDRADIYVNGEFMTSAGGFGDALDTIYEYYYGGDYGTDAIFMRYAIPGGENYREILIEIPGLGSRYDEAALSAIEKKIAALESSGRNEAEIDAERRALYAEERRLLNEGVKSEYKSKHFGRQEIVHIRADDRVGAGGEKILFANEVQADIHQQGRIYGYRSDVTVERMNEISKEIESINSEEARVRKIREKELIEATNKFDTEITKLEFELDELVLANRGEGGRVKISDEDYFPIHESLTEKIDSLIIRREKLKDPILNKYGDFFARSGKRSRDLSVEYNKLSRLATDAPYKGEAWLELALKRLLFHAVENGYDAISWARSDQIAKAVGADPAKLSLQYDQKIGRFLDKYTKKWGGKVETETGIVDEGKLIKDTPTIIDGPDPFGADTPDGWGAVDGGTVQDINRMSVVGGENQILRITPEMRASVMEGQPLSARGGEEASILGKADPDNLIAYLAAKAIENEAAQTGRTPIAEAIRTARHEVMEIAKAIGLISEHEWSRLTKDAKAKGWIESQGVRDAYESMYKEGMNPDQLEQLLLKEAIFEKFADFESRGKPPRNYAERVYQRIVDFFKSTMRGMREKLGIESSDDIFHKFDTGEMKKRFAEAGIERPKTTEDGLYAARKAPPEPSPIETAMASLRAELGMQIPKPWKGGKVAGIRQQAVSIAQLGGEQIMRLHGKQIAPALSKHEDAISGLSLPGSPEPFADGFKRAFNDYILRPDRFAHDNPELFNALRDALDAHTPHLLESIDAMHDMARERVTKLRKEELFIPVEEDKSTAAFVKKIAATPIKDLISKPFHVAWDAYRKTFQPELFGPKALETDAAIASMNSASQQGKDALYLAEENKLSWWKKQTMKMRMQYLYDAEIGANQRSPTLAKMMKQDNERLLKSYNLEKQIGSKAGYVEDYFPHLFKKPEQAVKWLADNTSKLGPDWFQKHRHHDLINDALKAGLELRSTNPAELILWRLMAGVDMRMRVQMLQDAKDIGTAVRLADLGKVEALQLENAGWQKVKAPNMDEWAISPEVQPLWKNSIDSRSLWQAEGVSGNIYRTWMAYKNTIVPIKLSLSLFHPTHVWSINFADKLALAYSQMTRTGDFVGAMKTLATSWWAGQGEGFDARMAWEKPKEERSKHENYLVWLLTEGGLVPTMPEEMKAVFARGMKEAYAEGRILKVLPEAMRKGVQAMQTPFFERWIPGLKAQSYIAQVRLLLESKPYLLDDPIKRRVAFRSIAKSVDNRFGEMFYKNMFWNRFVKDAGVASFLSLGWQTGFVREFGGAAAKFVIYPFAKAYLPKDNPYLLAMESNNKIAFALSYVSTSLMMAGGITWMCTGEEPKEWDYVFPRIGGTNPDGTPRRVTTPFFTREAPMAMKHIQERGGNVPAGLGDMMWNKMMYQPFAEYYRNRDYWGYEITDENAPWYKRWSQFATHAFTETVTPITMSGAMRAKELSGLYDDNIFEAATKDKSIGLSVLGFSPAPAYAERTALENRIRHLYAEHKAPLKKPYEAQELDEIKRLAKQKLRRAIQEGDDVAAAEAKKEAIDAGSSRQSLTKKKLNTPSSTFLFSQLPIEDQRMLLKEASPEERNFFRKYARQKIRSEFPVEPVQ